MAATDALAATKDDEPTANGREFKNRLIRVHSRGGIYFFLDPETREVAAYAI